MKAVLQIVAVPSTLPAVEMKIYATISAIAGNAETELPPRDALAKLCGVNSHTLRRSLKRLESLGLAIVTNRGGLKRRLRVVLHVIKPEIVYRLEPTELIEKEAGMTKKHSLHNIHYTTKKCLLLDFLHRLLSFSNKL